ncbi:MAG: FGGY-family carbohydrate kinase, partial [Actinomycetota bacterium]
ELLASPADRFGLASGIPVAAGAADTAAALLGAGVAVGETQLSTGSGGQLARLIDRVAVDPIGRTHLYRAVGAHWYAMAAIQNAGLAIDWAIDLLGAAPEEVASVMDGSPDRADEAVVFLPYLSGERTPHLDPALTGSWVGLRPGTSRSALIRSVFEGVAFALRDGLDALRGAGHPIDQALLAGGGSVAPWWRRLLADALELPLVAHDAADASVRGAGLLGWSSIGVEIDPGAAVRRSEPIVPSDAGVARLAAGRARFLAAGPGLPAGSGGVASVGSRPD